MADNTVVGRLLGAPQERDAIHVAVASVRSADRLFPGQQVAMMRPGDVQNVIGSESNSIGIVDPFLTHPVNAGEWFWVFLYPATITSLKHNWTHPAFNAELTPGVEETPQQVSERWLREFIAGADCPSYETTIAAAMDVGDTSWDNDYLHFYGDDAHGEIPPEFWDHVEIVTGRTIVNRPKAFSCSC